MEPTEDHNLVPVPEVICSINPTKLGSVPIAYQHTLGEKTGRHLGDNSVFDPFAAVLDGVQVFVTASQYKIVFVVYVDVVPLRFHDRLHPPFE